MEAKNYPTLRDLYNLITAKLHSEKSFKYKDILLWIQNRLYPYTINETFNCRIGLPYDYWNKENLIIEMDEGFTDNMYSFIVSYLAGLRYNQNKKMGFTGSKLSTLFTVDEARILFQANRDKSIFGETYINEIITKTREFGIGFIIASQETASFNQTVRSISYLKVAFPLNDAKDLDFIKESFGLEKEQAKHIFKLPKHGQAIVRYGGYENPFLIAVPHFRIKKQLSDAEVEDRMKEFYGEIEKSIKKESVQKPLDVRPTMPPQASALLYYLGQEPFIKVSEMTKAAGFKSPREVSKALEWLESEGYVKRESYRTSKRGRKSSYAVLTEKTYTYIGNTKPRGKGSFEHALYQHLIKQHLVKQGIKAEVEAKIRGKKACDVLAENKDKSVIAYEVTLSFENLISNVQKDLEAGASEVFIVTRDSKDFRKAEENVYQVSTLQKKKISFLIIDHFFS